jgi:hypothetical protein
MDNEWIEERAAILEFEAGYSRADAEKLAEQMEKAKNEKRTDYMLV